MHTPTRRIVAFVLFSVALLGPAEARRVALVIGNSAYRNVEMLPNPVNDASAVGAALGRLQFDKVTVLRDLGKEAMSLALQTFENEAAGVDIALIYFAGHGIEVDGQNYLIPTDARLSSATAVEFEAIELSKVTKRIEGARKLRLVILDACRNNPFRARMATDGSSKRRSIGRGLGVVEPGDNELVAFSAGHGTEADDGTGMHSPFTMALLKHIETPNLEVGLLFRHVRDEVVATTKRQQTPHIYGTLGSEQIFLKPRVPFATATAPGNIAVEYDAIRKRLEELEVQMKRQNAADASSAVAPTITPVQPQAAPPLVAISAEADRQRAAAEEKRKAEVVERQRLAMLTLEQDKIRAAAAEDVAAKQRAEESAKAAEARRRTQESEHERRASLKAQNDKQRSDEALTAGLKAAEADERGVAGKRKARTEVLRKALEKRSAREKARSAGTSRATVATRPANLAAYSLGIWPVRSITEGQTVSTITKFGRLTCTSNGYGTPRTCSVR